MSKKKHILIIDDEEDFAYILQRRLEASGYEVMTAGDGMAGLEIMRKECVDLILLDIMMPRMDGFTFIKIIKEEDRVLPMPPIIVMTAYGKGFGDDHRHMLKGIPVVNKPFEFDDLLSLVRERIQ
jgi:CheY-like chemotaxis protein